MRAERGTFLTRGWCALAIHALLILGLALFVAVVRESRSGLTTISAPWATAFGLTLLCAAAWLAVYVTSVAFVARRRVDDLLAGTVWSALPLAVPTGLALAAYASDAAHHALTRTDDLRWLWTTGIGVWAALQLVTFVLALDGASLRPVAWARRIAAAARESAFTRLTFPMVFVQFVVLRLMLALLWQPFAFYERGSDAGAYEQRARLALQGLQPYLDYWVEYPPVFPWTASGLKMLSLHVGGTEAAFQVLFSLSMVVFEAGILLLIYRIACRVWDPSRALMAALAYALLFFPLYIANRHFEPMPVFFLLLGLYAVIENRRHAAAMALSLGMLTKIFPIAGFPALLAGARWAQRARYLALSLALLAAALLPLALRGREFFVASMQNMALRPGWETVWALADGYFSFGWIHPYRQSPDTATQFNYAPDLPGAVWPVAAAVLLAFYAYLALRRSSGDPAGAVWVTAAALAAFALYLKGWSPQFTVWLLPFVVIAYPGGRGFLLATALSLLALLEYPAYFALWSDLAWVLWVIVIVRTIAIGALLVLFLRRLWALDRVPAEPAPAPAEV